jgi:4'-phosphopantetheinyl transferase EntD
MESSPSRFMDVDAPTDNQGLAGRVTASLRQILPVGAIALARAITPSDAGLLRPEELEDFGEAVPKVLAQSGAARAAARALLVERGQLPATLRRGASRAPLWPVGIVGSLSHTATIAAAAIAPEAALSGLGIDLEHVQVLDPALAAMILTEREAQTVEGRTLEVQMHFCIKEAVFKAVHPLDGIFLDFKDVELDLWAGTARTSYGRTVEWSARTVPMLIAAAWVPSMAHSMRR